MRTSDAIFSIILRNESSMCGGNQKRGIEIIKYFIKNVYEKFSEKFQFFDSLLSSKNLSTRRTISDTNSHT